MLCIECFGNTRCLVECSVSHKFGFALFGQFGFYFNLIGLKLISNQDKNCIPKFFSFFLFIDKLQKKKVLKTLL